MATKTKAAEPKKAPVKVKAKKKEPVTRNRIDYKAISISGVPSEPWRREGTANYTRAKEVISYMKKKPRASVAELFEKTSYRPQDYQWDVSRNIFKVVKASGAPA